MPDVGFKAEVDCIGPTCAVARTREFTFRVDEPEALGGTDTGPNPVEYILGAYAGCLNVVGHMVAEEMGISLDHIKIDVEGMLNPAGFMGQDPSVRSGFHQINVSFDVKSDADEETLERWLEAVNSRCPVGDNLKNPTPVTARMNIID